MGIVHRAESAWARFYNSCPFVSGCVIMSTVLSLFAAAIVLATAMISCNSSARSSSGTTTVTREVALLDGNGNQVFSKDGKPVTTKIAVAVTTPSSSISAPEINQELKNKMPAVSVGADGRVKVGSGGAESDSEGSGASVNFFWVAGLLFIALGAGAWFLTGNISWSLACAGLGGLSIGIGVTIQYYPWIWLLLIPGVLAFSVYLLWDKYKSGELNTAFNGVVKGVAGLKDRLPEAYEAVKSSIEDVEIESKANIKAWVDKAKAKINKLK